MNNDYSKIDPESSEFYEKFLRDILNDIRNIRATYKDKDSRAEKYVELFFTQDNLNIEKLKSEDMTSIYINIDQEILKGKRKITKDYWIDCHYRIGDDCIVGRYREIHGCFAGYWEEYSLESLYDNKFEEIDKTYFDSDDLLKQILVSYLIKRAQKGDVKAYNKLFSFFEDKAIFIALNFIHSKSKELSLKFDPEGELGDDRVKQTARIILSLLLQGDQLRNLQNLLKEKNRNSDSVEHLLTRKLKDIITNYVENKLIKEIMRYFLVTQKIEEEIKHSVDQTRDNLAKFDSSKVKYCQTAVIPIFARFILKRENFSIEEYYELAKDDNDKKKILTIILDNFNQQLEFDQQKTTITFMAITVIDPFFWPKNDSRFNRDLYRPNKKTPLGVWLFGKKSSRGSERGRFWTKLNDWYKSSRITYTKVIDGDRRRLIKPDHIVDGYKKLEDEDLSFWPKYEEENESGGMIQKDFSNIIDDIEQYKQKKKISDRDIEIIKILCLKKHNYPDLNKVRQRHIAVKYKLSIRQIRRILKKYQDWAIN